MPAADSVGRVARPCAHGRRQRHPRRPRGDRGSARPASSGRAASSCSSGYGVLESASPGVGSTAFGMARTRCRMSPDGFAALGADARARAARAPRSSTVAEWDAYEEHYAGAVERWAAPTGRSGARAFLERAELFRPPTRTGDATRWASGSARFRAPSLTARVVSPDSRGLTIVAYASRTWRSSLRPIRQAIDRAAMRPRPVAAAGVRWYVESHVRWNPRVTVPALHGCSSRTAPLTPYGSVSVLATWPRRPTPVPALDIRSTTLAELDRPPMTARSASWWRSWPYERAGTNRGIDPATSAIARAAMGRPRPRSPRAPA